MLVELDDEGRGDNGVFGEEDGFGFFRVRAVGFGEDYDCEMAGKKVRGLKRGLQIADCEEERHIRKEMRDGWVEWTY